MPQSQSHLERRGSAFRWRRRVPSRLLVRIVAPCVSVALKTDLLSEAKRRARRLDQLSDLIFALMESADVLGEGLDERIITELARFEIAAADATRARAPARSRLDAELAFQREAAYREVLRDAYLLRDREVARQPIRAACARLGVSIAEDTDDWRALADRATRALIEVSEIRERRDRGLFDAPLPAVTAAMRGIDPPAQPIDAAAIGPGHPCPSQLPPCAEPVAMPERAVMAASATMSASAAASSIPVGAVRAGHPAPQSQPVCPTHGELPATPTEIATAADTRLVGALPQSRLGRPDNHRDVLRGNGESHLALVTPEGFDEPPVKLEHPSTGMSPIEPARGPRRIGSPDRRGDRPDPAAAPAPSAGSAACAAQGAPLQSHPQCPPASAPRSATLSEAFAFYIDGKQQGRTSFHPLETPSRKKGTSWTRHSLSNAKAARTILLGLLGDLPIDEIPQERMSEALAMLERLPDNWGKSEVERRRKTIVEVVHDADRRDARILEKLRKRHDAGAISRGNFEVMGATLTTRRISVNTRIKHMREFNRMFKAAQAGGLARTNPMDGRLLPQSVIDELLVQEEDRGRKPWRSKIHDLYATPLFTQVLEDPSDPLFWATIIAPRSGLRSEEIYQLGPDDIRVEGGIYFFNITNGPGQHLKSKAARRRVPIHSEIIALGFLELVALRQRQGERRLFPDLKRGAGKETFTAIMSKRFGYYRRKHGLYDRTRDFHSLRTGFNVDLIDAGVDGTVRRALMGHEETDVGILNYLPGGHPLHVLQKAVETVQIGIDGIRPPFLRATARPASPLRVVQ